MKTKLVLTLIVTAIVPLAILAQTEKLSVKSLAPVVVKAVPETGSTDVDAATTTEIRVTFSKPMQDRSWSWTGGGETFPELVGQPRYLTDGRTCVLTVKLQPGKTYVIGINSPSHKNFKDRQGRPAMPYLVAFETKN